MLVLYIPGFTSLTYTVITTIVTTTQSSTFTAVTTVANEVTTSTIIQQNITTVAGSFNGSYDPLSGDLTTLHYQGGIAVSKNGTLYVADGDPVDAVLAFEPNNFTGKPIMTFSDWPAYIFIDPITSLIYATASYPSYAQIWPSNQTIPENPSPTCSTTTMQAITGIIVDTLGYVYISSGGCHAVYKWNSNGTITTIVAGLLSTSGSSNQRLNKPYGLFIDENNSLLYVADSLNNRIQKFVLGNLTAITVAGGNGAGSASNQLNYPTTIYVSKQDNSYYICDYCNNRVQRWAINATYGVTIAGSSTAVAGNALNLLNHPYDIWVHPNETYMLISDSNNCRVQKYIL